MNDKELNQDLFWEHSAHDTFQEKCSDCFKENRIIQAHKIVTHEDILERHPALKDHDRHINNEIERN